jgi:hypothetical protein
MDLRSSGTRVFSQSIEYSNLDYGIGSVAVFKLPLIVKKQTQIRIISHMDKKINRLSHCKLVGGPNSCTVIRTILEYLCKLWTSQGTTSHF